MNSRAKYSPRVQLQRPALGPLCETELRAAVSPFTSPNLDEVAVLCERLAGGLMWRGDAAKNFLEVERLDDVIIPRPVFQAPFYNARTGGPRVLGPARGEHDQRGSFLSFGERGRLEYFPQPIPGRAAHVRRWPVVVSPCPLRN